MKSSMKWKLGVAAVLIVSGAAYGVIIIHHGFSSRDRPSRVEAFVAQAARSMATPARMKSMKNPITPSPEVYAEARAHWADHCAQCHGNNGSGDTPMGRTLYPRPPDMRSSYIQSKSDGELYHPIQYGIRLSGMPAFGDPVDNDMETWKLVAFIRHLPNLSEQEELEMERLNPKSPEEMREEMEEDQFLNGGNASAPPKMSTMHH